MTVLGGTVVRSSIWRLDPLWLPLSVLGAVFAVVAYVAPMHWDLMSWHLLDVHDPYAAAKGLQGEFAFRYTPPMVVLFAPLTLLPLPVLQALWFGLQLAALRYLAGRWFLAAIILPPVWIDMMYGNIVLLLAAMTAAGMRYPWLWTFGLLTKVTPAVGLVWFAARREWQALAACVVATGALVLMSVAVLGPGPWAEWLGLLVHWSALPAPPGAIAVPASLRLVAATVLVAWGARTDRQWVVPVGVTLAMPSLWPVAFAPLLALGRDGQLTAAMAQTAGLPSVPPVK